MIKAVYTHFFSDLTSKLSSILSNARERGKPHPLVFSPGFPGYKRATWVARRRFRSIPVAARRLRRELRRAVATAMEASPELLQRTEPRVGFAGEISDFKLFGKTALVVYKKCVLLFRTIHSKSLSHGRIM